MWSRSTSLPVRLILLLAIALSGCSDEDGTGDTFTTVVVPSSTAPSPEEPTDTAPASSTASTDAPGSTTGTTTTTAPLAELQALAYSSVADGVDFPIVLTARPGDDASVVAFKGGTVARLTEGGMEEILDISRRISSGGERGLLGLALHPDDVTRVFIHYSDVNGDTVVSEFAMDGSIDADSEQVLFTAAQPAGNHNGGWIQIADDGALYLGLGDGGGADDAFGTGQADTPLAGLVRIDVDSGAAEKYASGLRNPWRFRIDGDLVYVADVGQNAYEEVSVAPLEPGVNYGWSIMEATHCFSPREGCDTGGLLLPVVEVEHGDAGTCSITGGVVYEGSAIPELAGHYFYSDYCGGYLRSFRFEEDEAADQTDWTEDVGVAGAVVSFGVDGSGEIYVLTTSEILRIEPVR